VLLREVHKKDDFITLDVFNLISLLKVESELQTLKVSTGTLSNEWEKPLNDPHVVKVMQKINLIDYLIHSKKKLKIRENGNTSYSYTISSSLFSSF
jgi:hypothetical protein